MALKLDYQWRGSQPLLKNTEYWYNNLDNILTGHPPPNKPIYFQYVDSCFWPILLCSGGTIVLWLGNCKSHLEWIQTDWYLNTAELYLSRGNHLTQEISWANWPFIEGAQLCWQRHRTSCPMGIWATHFGLYCVHDINDTASWNCAISIVARIVLCSHHLWSPKLQQRLWIWYICQLFDDRLNEMSASIVICMLIIL